MTVERLISRFAFLISLLMSDICISLLRCRLAATCDAKWVRSAATALVVATTMKETASRACPIRQQYLTILAFQSSVVPTAASPYPSSAVPGAP